MGEAVDTIPSILNKCLFVSPTIPSILNKCLFVSSDRQTDRQTDMINHQKPAYENGKLRPFYTAGLLLNKRRQRWL